MTTNFELRVNMVNKYHIPLTQILLTILLAILLLFIHFSFRPILKLYISTHTKEKSSATNLNFLQNW